MKKIGPILSIQDNAELRMQDAFETDGEHGAHWLNNEASSELNRRWPTVVAMAMAIEAERDRLKGLADWAETLLCNSLPAVGPNEEWKNIITRWRDEKHGVKAPTPNKFKCTVVQTITSQEMEIEADNEDTAKNIALMRFNNEKQLDIETTVEWKK